MKRILFAALLLCSVRAFAQIHQYTYWYDTLYVTASAVNGTITPDGQVPAFFNGSKSFSYSPTAGYSFDSVMINGVANYDSNNSYTFNRILDSNDSITVYFSDIIDFYVDATNGSDANIGDINNPWQTLAKVKSAAANDTITRGSVIAFKRGETFLGDLDWSTPDSVVFTSYGTGAKPIIDMGEYLTGTWTDEGSNVWSTSYATNVANSHLWYGYNDTIYWGYEQASSAACTQTGYFYSPGTTFYIYSVDNPNTYYSFIATSINTTSISADTLTFEHLQFQFGGGTTASGSNLRANNAHYMTIDDCIFRYSSNENVYFLSSYSVIKNSIFYDSHIHGIWFGSYWPGGPYYGFKDTLEYCTFWNNYYTNVDMGNGIGDHLSNDSCGHHVIRFNKILGVTADRYTGTSNNPTNIAVKGEGNIGYTENRMVGVKIYGNLFKAGPASGVQITKFVDSLYFYNNTIDSSSGWGMQLGYLTENAGYYYIKNNIFTSVVNSTHGIKITDGSVITNWDIDYNLYYNTGTSSSDIGYYSSSYYSDISSWNSATGFDANSYVSDPNYTNSSTNDYSIQTPSDAIDNGLTLESPYNYDILGVSRPQGSGYDIGAYER